MTTKFILENCKNIAGWEELNPSQRSQIMFFAELVHANGVMVGKEEGRGEAVEYLEKNMHTVDRNNTKNLFYEIHVDELADLLEAARNTP